MHDLNLPNSQPPAGLPDTQPLDAAAERRVRAYRLERVRQSLAQSDLAAAVLFDPVNIRYATGSRNMQVWTMHNLCRYVFVAADGPVVLFELPNCFHLAKDLETVDELRPPRSWDYLVVGQRAEEMARAWAEDIAELMRSQGGGSRRIAIDRADWHAGAALTALGFELASGQAVMERARLIKSQDEIDGMIHALRVCEAAMYAMRDTVCPGVREDEALAELLRVSTQYGGEYPETRLLTSGPRTNPWFQETSDRVMESGDLLSFDTDLIGPGGWYADISRSWCVSDVRPSDEQRRLFDLAREQLEHNMALLRPGMSFREMTETSWPVPDAYKANRYADIAHGVGLGVEYPLIYYPEDYDRFGYDGVFEAGMMACIESYIGAEDGREGVKLEQPVLITESGPQLLSRYPFDEALAQ